VRTASSSSPAGMELPAEPGLASGSPSDSRHTLLRVLAASVVLLVVGALLMPRGGPSPISKGPEGTFAMRRFLAESDVEVREGGRPPAPPATFVLLQDLRTFGEERILLRWVAAGGRLVVADPGSAVMARFGVSSEVLGGPLIGNVALPAGCVLPETLGVHSLALDPRDRALTSIPARAVGCFPMEEGAFELSLSRGKGTIVLLGGSSFLANQRLGVGDDALFTLQLLRGEGPVVFGTPLPFAEGSHSLWGTLPVGARAALIGLAIAAILFALARARRLGRPVLEEPLSPIPASDLVQATATLHRRARTAAFCGEQLRRGFAERVRRRFGLPPGTPPGALPAHLERVTGRGREDLARLLTGPGPSGDEELVRMARQLEDVARRVEGRDRMRAWSVPASPTGVREREGRGP
jgi:hypothetical protein